MIPVMATPGAQVETAEPLRPATTVRRVEAAGTSFVPMMVIWMMFSCIVHIMADMLSAASAIAIVYGLPLLVFAAEGATCRATYGMRNRGILLRKVDGGQPGFGLCFVRIIAGVLLLPLLPVSAALQWTRGKTLADLLCGTQAWERATPGAVVRPKPAFPVTSAAPPATDSTRKPKP